MGRKFGDNTKKEGRERSGVVGFVEEAGNIFNSGHNIPRPSTSLLCARVLRSLTPAWGAIYENTKLRLNRIGFSLSLCWARTGNSVLWRLVRVHIQRSDQECE